MDAQDHLVYMYNFEYENMNVDSFSIVLIALDLYQVTVWRRQQEKVYKSIQVSEVSLKQSFLKY